MHRAVNNLLFKVHPYGQQSTLGTVEHLKNPSITAIEEFFAKHYVPENMAICISGNIDPDRTIEIIEKYFSSWKNPEALRPEPKWEEKPLKVENSCRFSIWARSKCYWHFGPLPDFTQIIQPFAWLI